MSEPEYQTLITKDNISTDAPEIKRVEWKNKRTGQIEQIPEGIDPGFDTNPGKYRLQNLNRQLEQKKRAAPIELRSQYEKIQLPKAEGNSPALPSKD